VTWAIAPPTPASLDFTRPASDQGDIGDPSLSDIPVAVEQHRGRPKSLPQPVGSLLFEEERESGSLSNNIVGLESKGPGS
jgi:hypothetical protein